MDPKVKMHASGATPTTPKATAAPVVPAAAPKVAAGAKVAAAPVESYGFGTADLTLVQAHGKFTSWDKMINWLMERSSEGPELSEPKRQAMITALRHLGEAKVPFTNDPAAVMKALGTAKKAH